MDFSPDIPSLQASGTDASAEKGGSGDLELARGLADLQDSAGYWLQRLLHYQPGLIARLSDLLNTVVAHVPRVIAEMMIRAPHTNAIAVSLEGTVMFADIDGFTPLAERFSQVASEEGAEELTELVNRFMGILIPITARYGGDLQKFGGDAGLLLFHGEEHALRAVAASVEVQQALKSEMREVKTSLGTFPLQVAIGLGSGRMVGLGLGNQQGRDWLLVGPTLASMGRAQNVAPPDETVIDAPTLAACQDAIAYTAVGKELYQVTNLQVLPVAYAPLALPGPPKVTEALRLEWLLSRLDALSPYLAPGLLERLVTVADPDRMGLLSDLRQVTVMMLSLSDILAESNSQRQEGFESRESLWSQNLLPFWGDVELLQQGVQSPNEMFVRIRDTIRRYDGIVNKIGMSPQGPYIMALFGAPCAHEDDPLRAVLAAIELQESFNASLRFGINTGYVFAGDLGTSDRREYTVMGDEVNLGYRLMSQCDPGDIWLGPHTYHHSAVQRRVDGELGAPTKFKGKRDRITPFIARDMRRVFLGASVSDIPLVGREDEIQRLTQLLRQAKAGMTQVVLVHGRAGVGKSSLARELMRIASEMGFAVHSGYAPSYGMHLPFAAWEGALMSLLGCESGTLEDRQRAMRESLSHYGLDVWAALLAPLVGLEHAPSSEVLSLPANMREKRRQGALRELWEKAAFEQPRLLILENAHWMPPASLELLDALMQVLDDRPLMILVTYRDEPSISEHWKSANHYVDMPVNPLSAEAMQTLVRHLFQDTPLPAQVSQWVSARSGGLPLFASEAVRALVDSGMLRRQEDSWELTGSLNDFPLPDMVYGVIQSRIDQLAPPSRHLLRAASVVGSEMTILTLIAAYGEESESAVRRRVPQLKPFGLIPRDDVGEIFSFSQPLVREVAYRGLPQKMKRLIHYRLAEYLDYAREHAVPNWLDLLAYHAYEGHVWERAVEANLELGKRALQSYLALQALEAFERALEAADNGGLPAPDLRFSAHRYLGETLTILGQSEDALLHLEAARKLLPPIPTEPVDIARMADLEHQAAMAYEALGEYDRALVAVDRGLGLPGVQRTLEGARLYLVGSDLYRRKNDYAQARAWAQRSVALCAISPGPETQQLRSRALYMLALLASLERFGM